MGILAWAIVLTLFAPASRAADDAAGEIRASSSIESLRNGAGRPEDFQRVVEGSPSRQDGPNDPRFFEPRKGGGPNHDARLSPPRPGELTGMPAPPLPGSSIARWTAPNQSAGISDLSARKLAGVFGLGLLLVGAGLLGTALESPPIAEARGDAEPPSVPLAPMGTPEPATERLPAPRSGSVFIDTRMPAPTWRAVSWREQKLIERWDASPEKALGRASLAEWLDAKGPFAGVDVPLLKSKLQREA